MSDSSASSDSYVCRQRPLALSPPESRRAAAACPRERSTSHELFGLGGDVRPHPDYQDESGDLVVISSDDWRFLLDKSDLQGASTVFKSMFKEGSTSAHLSLDSAGRAQIALVDVVFEDSWTFAAILGLLPGSKVKHDSRLPTESFVYARGYWEERENDAWTSQKSLAFAQKWDCPTIIDTLVRQIDRSLSPLGFTAERARGCLLIMFTIAAQADAVDTCSRLISWYGGRTNEDEFICRDRSVVHDAQCPCADCSTGANVCEKYDWDCDGDCHNTTENHEGLVLDPKAMRFGMSACLPEEYVFALSRAMAGLMPGSSGEDRRHAARVFEVELSKAKSCRTKRKR